MNLLDYRAIRQRISMGRVLELVRYEPAARRGFQWRGPCPFCRLSAEVPHDRCFSVNLRRGLFRCFRCGRSGNQLDLWIQFCGLPPYPATLDLCARLGLQPVILNNPQPRLRT